MTRNGVRIDGFIVTQAGEDASALEHSVLTASKMMHGNMGIIIGLGDIYTKEVVEYLREQKVDFSSFVDGVKYISKDRESKELQDNPTVEITTVVGCNVNCRYCSQSVLLGRYFAKDKIQKSIMMLEDLKVFVGLHVADEEKYANIPVSEEYYQNIDC